MTNPTMTNPTMTELKLTLSGGIEVTLGRLRWQGFKLLKALIARTVSGPLLREVGTILTGPLGKVATDVLSAVATRDAGSVAKWTDDDALSAVSGSIEHVLEIAPKLLQEALSTSDELTELLIEHSLRKSGTQGGVLLALLDVSDITALREAALSLNDFPALLATEKNWLAEVVTTGQKCLGSMVPTSAATSASNT